MNLSKLKNFIKSLILRHWEPTLKFGKALLQLLARIHYYFLVYLKTKSVENNEKCVNLIAKLSSYLQLQSTFVNLDCFIYQQIVTKNLQIADYGCKDSLIPQCYKLILAFLISLTMRIKQSNLITFSFVLSKSNTITFTSAWTGLKWASLLLTIISSSRVVIRKVS